MLNNNILIIIFVFITSTLSAQSVEVRMNANNDPRVEIVNPGANTFIGDEAGRINTGLNNTFSGHQAGYSNVEGSQISFFGQNAGYSNTSGNFNSLFGWRAGFMNNSGSSNSFFGSDAGFANTTGADNSFYGVAVGLGNTTGKENCFFGIAAGSTNKTGEKNTIVGSLADVTASNLINATAIGFNAKVGTSNSLVLGGTGVNAVRVGIGTTSPNPSAALDLTSTTKGFLPPRMTVAERDAIAGPAAGLFIWCTNCTAFGAAQIYNGYFWTTLTNQDIGQSYQGGIIAYVLQPGDPGYDANVPHGLIAAPTDQSAGLQWYNGIYIVTGATGTALGTGQSNTTTIVTSQGAGSYAAQLCDDLALNGYSDWYLPSKDELNKLYLNQVAISGFVSDHYWSSSEFDVTYTWYQLFSSGYQGNAVKTGTYKVRAVRAF